MIHNNNLKGRLPRPFFRCAHLCPCVRPNRHKSSRPIPWMRIPPAPHSLVRHRHERWSGRIHCCVQCQISTFEAIARTTILPCVCAPGLAARSQNLSISQVEPRVTFLSYKRGQKMGPPHNPPPAQLQATEHTKLKAGGELRAAIAALSVGLNMMVAVYLSGKDGQTASGTSLGRTGCPRYLHQLQVNHQRIRGTASSTRRLEGFVLLATPCCRCQVQRRRSMFWVT